MGAPPPWPSHPFPTGQGPDSAGDDPPPTHQSASRSVHFSPKDEVTTLYKKEDLRVDQYIMTVIRLMKVRGRVGVGVGVTELNYLVL